MQVTRYTDYAIRVLIYLAVHKDEVVTIKDIAESYGISKNHLMKIVQTLNAEKFLQATRGKNGGLQLISEPRSINIGQLVRKFENHSNLVECFGENNRCVITPSCQLQKVFSQALESFYQVLDEFSLADLVRDNNRSELSTLLSVNQSDNIAIQQES